MVNEGRRAFHRGCRATAICRLGSRRCFTIIHYVVLLSSITFILSSNLVSCKSPSLFPQNSRSRRGPGSKSSKNANDNAIRLVSATKLSTKPNEAAWLSGLKNSLASGLAAGCSKLLLAPFDTIKTLQQASLVSGEAPLNLSKAAQEILKRPKGFLEFYVSSN